NSTVWYKISQTVRRHHVDCLSLQDRAIFKELIGELLTSKAQVLVNTVNCVGIMGKGVAQEFKKRYPAMFKDYESRCEDGRVRIGEPYLYREEIRRAHV